MISISRGRFALVAVVFALLAGLSPAVGQALDLERIQRATVLIMLAQNDGDRLIITCVASGTVVSRDGLILTNAHIAVPGQNCPGDTLVVAMNVRAGEPPVAQYLADVVQANVGLDLALIRIARQTDGRVIERSRIALPFVEVGDSNALALDETITIVGYPGLGNDPLSIVRSTIAGFAAEPSGGDRSWLRSSTAVPALMTGGGVYNRDGQLIAVPSTAPIASTVGTTDCIAIQDTNSDRLISADDRCVPVGGFLNLLRPSAFVEPLLRAARLDLQVEIPQTLAPDSGTSTGSAELRYLGFAPSVNEAGMPSTIIRSLPAGSDSLYLFFDYANMTPETVYEVRVNTNGVPNPSFAVSPVRWSGGTQGLWYVGGSGQPYPNGIYDFTLFINGVAEGNARLSIGGASDPAPEFGDIVFGLLDAQGNVSGTGYVLPTGTTASARFLYRNMAPGTPWAAIWYYEGREIQRSPDDSVWDAADGTSGTKTISIQDPGGLPPGNYRLELYADNRLSAVSDFTLAGVQDGAFARVFSNTRFSTASTTQQAESALPLTSVSAGVSQIYALFDWDLVAAGTLWRSDWLVDGQLFYSQSLPWQGAPSGQGLPMRLSSPGGLPDGTYRLDLYIGSIQFDTADIRVGIGQLPIDRFASTEGVVLRGRAINALSGEGVANASVLLISEDYSVSEFTAAWDQNQIFDTAITDRNGRFEFSRPLQRDAPYSIVIVADGFLPVTADGVELNEETRPDASDPTPIDVTVELTPEQP